MLGTALPPEIRNGGHGKMMNKAAGDQLWIEAAKRYHLSPAHVKMARELGMAVARKLSVLLHRLWVTGAEYDPDYRKNVVKQAA
jgi:hypothetical protein